MAVRYISSQMERDFARFHGENPRVYEVLRDLALAEMKVNRKRKLGIAALWERMRWHMDLETKNTDFKLPNNHRSRYARLLMKQEPELSTFFTIRPLRNP